MTGPDTSVVGGMVLIVALVGTNFVIGRLDRIPRFHQLVSGSPSVIIKDGEFVPDALKREGLTPDEAEMAIREHGVEDLKEGQRGVLEPDGTISIVPRGEAGGQSRRNGPF